MKIQYYERLRDNLNYVAYYLNQASSSLDNIDNIMLKDYNIDEIIPSNNRISPLRNDILSKVNYIYYTIIPAINRKIDSLK